MGRSAHRLTATLEEAQFGFRDFSEAYQIFPAVTSNQVPHHHIFLSNIVSNTACGQHSSQIAEAPASAAPLPALLLHEVWPCVTCSPLAPSPSACVS